MVIGPGSVSKVACLGSLLRFQIVIVLLQNHPLFPSPPSGAAGIWSNSLLPPLKGGLDPEAAAPPLHRKEVS